MYNIGGHACKRAWHRCGDVPCSIFLGCWCSCCTASPFYHFCQCTLAANMFTMISIVFARCRGTVKGSLWGECIGGICGPWYEITVWWEILYIYIHFQIVVVFSSLPSCVTPSLTRSIPPATSTSCLQPAPARVFTYNVSCAHGRNMFSNACECIRHFFATLTCMRDVQLALLLNASALGLQLACKCASGCCEHAPPPKKNTIRILLDVGWSWAVKFEHSSRRRSPPPWWVNSMHIYIYRERERTNI
jgi:hypothetical protein